MAPGIVGGGRWGGGGQVEVPARPPPLVPPPLTRPLSPGRGHTWSGAVHAGLAGRPQPGGWLGGRRVGECGRSAVSVWAPSSRLMPPQPPIHPPTHFFPPSPPPTPQLPQLDAARAALALPPAAAAGLAPASPIALTGFSQGGVSALFAGSMAPAYAPELNIVAVSGGGVITDPVRQLNDADRPLDMMFTILVRGGVGGWEAGCGWVGGGGWVGGRWEGGGAGGVGRWCGGAGCGRRGPKCFGGQKPARQTTSPPPAVAVRRAAESHPRGLRAPTPTLILPCSL